MNRTNLRKPRNALVLLAAAATLGLLLPVGVQATPPTLGAGHYKDPGIVVVNFNIGLGQITVADNGAVVCRDVNADGTPDHGRGGVCIPFGDLQGDSIQVVDDDVGLDVAFQVCIDNNGDSLCGPPTDNLFSCQDTIVYSHDSATGAFFNPLKLSQLGFTTGCPGGPFPGVVVMICAGLHDNEFATNLHFHNASEGQVTSVNGGTGTGDYCTAPASTKAYELAPPGL